MAMWPLLIRNAVVPTMKILRPISTVAAAKLDIKSALDSFITDANKIDVQFPQPPPGFPFTIEDIPDDDYITLKRDFGGEKIALYVFGPYYKYYDRMSIRKISPQYTHTKFRLEVSKPSGNSFDVYFAADSNSVELVDADADAYFNIGQASCGSECWMAQSDQNKFWREYIGVRGVDDSIREFLMQYMDKRADCKFLLFLKKFRKFVQ